MASPKIKNSLNEFKSNFFGVVKPTLYEVVIMGSGYQNTINIVNSPAGSREMGTKLLTINCEGAVLPGAAFSTQPNRIYGPVTEYPYERLYSGDLSLTFRLDQEMWLRKFFNAWQGLIFKDKQSALRRNTRGRMWQRLGMGFANRPSRAGDFEYSDVYTGEIEIYQYPTKQKASDTQIPLLPQENNDKPIYGVRLFGVYPKSIAAIELGYAAVDTYSKQTVEFAYRNWEEIPADEF